MKAEYGLREMTAAYLCGNEHAKHVYGTAGFTETDVVEEEGCREANMICLCE